MESSEAPVPRVTLSRDAEQPSTTILRAMREILRRQNVDNLIGYLDLGFGVYVHRLMLAISSPSLLRPSSASESYTLQDRVGNADAQTLSLLRDLIHFGIVSWPISPYPRTQQIKIRATMAHKKTCNFWEIVVLASPMFFEWFWIWGSILENFNVSYLFRFRVFLKAVNTSYETHRTLIKHTPTRNFCWKPASIENGFLI
jgi:hypothetical protein